MVFTKDIHYGLLFHVKSLEFTYLILSSELGDKLLKFLCIFLYNWPFMYVAMCLLTSTYIIKEISRHELSDALAVSVR